MPLDIDPIYYTETMVKILRDQGSTLSAMELCEKILEQDPGHQGIRQILEELKGEARASFDRFRSSGNAKPQVDPVREVRAPTHAPKLQKLEALLHRVQGYRLKYEVTP
jgi:hypothetical protein